MRSPKPVASWLWILDNPEDMNFLAAGCSVSLNIARVLRESDLLYLEAVCVEWSDTEGGPLGYYTRIEKGLEHPTTLADTIRGARPAIQLNAEPYSIDLLGPGNWISSSGKKRGERELLSVKISVADEITSVEVSVNQDIWGENDFFGNPHPEIHASNSPRIHHALTAIEHLLGSPGDTGDPTYFGSASGYSVQSPLKGDGSGLDVTDRL